MAPWMLEIESVGGGHSKSECSFVVHTKLSGSFLVQTLSYVCSQVLLYGGVCINVIHCSEQHLELCITGQER